MARKKALNMGVATIGSDPEFFVRRIDSGAPTPICGLLGGTKGDPFMVGDYGVQEDNVMAEYNTPPADSPGSFARHVAMGRQAVMNRLEELYPGTYEPDLTPSRLFPFDKLEHPQAKMFGCSPDFDGYNMGAANPRFTPEDLSREGGAWRFCGGHVHIGYKHLLTYEMPEYVVATFADVFLSLPLLDTDKQGPRRQYYGTPGRYRPTKYGIEYRTLSNRWTYSVGVSETVGYYAQALGNFLRRPEAEVKRAWAEIPWLDVRRAINEELPELSSSILNYCRNLGLEI